MKPTTIRILLSIVSGLLLWLSWPTISFTFLIFFALVPLFIAEDNFNGKGFFRYAFLAFLVWNTLTIYWIWHASAFGAIFAILLGTSLMALPWMFYRFTKQFFGEKIGLFSFVVYWLGYEYLHQEWQFSFPWLTLGNAFADYHTWVQWYEYTGVFGGSLWVLLANIFIYQVIKHRSELAKGDKIYLAKRLAVAAIIFLPILLSKIMYATYVEENNPVNVVVVQPNIDPYTDKFDNLPPEVQLEQLIRLSDSVGQANTEYFIWPETAIVRDINEDQLNSDYNIVLIQQFIERFKNASVITGATTYKTYTEKASSTARFYSNGACCYDIFNTALQIDNEAEIQVYHKSKLVAGVEQIPYVSIFGFLSRFSIDLGGSLGSLGTQKDRGVFYTKNGIGAAPVICYESVFGEFVTGYVKNGAQFITIITNDGWWKNTPGYKHHQEYAKLRAIETRRSIARSANTGISSFINQRGDVLQQSQWDEAVALKGDINLNDKITFYTRFGDFIPKTASVLAVLFMAFSFYRNKFGRSK